MSALKSGVRGHYYFPKAETLRLLRLGHPSYRSEEPLTLHLLLDRSCNQGIGDPISPEPEGPSAVPSVPHEHCDQPILVQGLHVYTCFLLPAQGVVGAVP